MKNLNRYIIIFTIITVFSSVLFPIKIQAQQPSDFAKPEIDDFIKIGLLNEKYQSDYQSDITRYDLCKLLIDILKELKIVSDRDYTSMLRPSPFTDIDDSDITLAYDIKVTSGIGHDMFGPERPIIRQDAAVVIRNFARELGLDTSGAQTNFSDETDISGYANESVNFVMQRALFDAPDNTFNPKNNISREQAYVAIYRLLHVLNEEYGLGEVFNNPTVTLAPSLTPTKTTTDKTTAPSSKPTVETTKAPTTMPPKTTTPTTTVSKIDDSKTTTHSQTSSETKTTTQTISSADVAIPASNLPSADILDITTISNNTLLKGKISSDVKIKEYGFKLGTRSKNYTITNSKKSFFGVNSKSYSNFFYNLEKGKTYYAVAYMKTEDDVEIMGKEMTFTVADKASTTQNKNQITSVPKNQSTGLVYGSESGSLGKIPVTLSSSLKNDSLVKISNGNSQHLSSVYLKKGESKTVYLDNGNYKFNVSSGDTWYGLADLFGKGGSYAGREQNVTIDESCEYTFSVSNPTSGKLTGKELKSKDWNNNSSANSVKSKNDLNWSFDWNNGANNNSKLAASNNGGKSFDWNGFGLNKSNRNNNLFANNGYSFGGNSFGLNNYRFGGLNGGNLNGYQFGNLNGFGLNNNSFNRNSGNSFGINGYRFGSNNDNSFDWSSGNLFAFSGANKNLSAANVVPLSNGNGKFIDFGKLFGGAIKSFDTVKLSDNEKTFTNTSLTEGKSFLNTNNTASAFINPSVLGGAGITITSILVALGAIPLIFKDDDDEDKKNGRK